MASWFRSQDMEFISMIVSEDAAHSCIRDIGKLGCVQFMDLNGELTPFQRRYVSGVKRCDEMERKLRFFIAEMEKFGIGAKSTTSVEVFLGEHEDQTMSSMAMLEKLETHLEEYEAQLLEFNKFHEKISTEFNEKLEHREVLEKSKDFFALEFSDERVSMPGSATPSPLHVDTGNSSTPLLDADMGMPVNQGFLDPDLMRFSQVCGVVAEADRSRFERALFRSTRGNCYVRFTPVDTELKDPNSGEVVEKCVFILFFKSASIETKINRICDAFSARRYPVPDLDDGGKAVAQAILLLEEELKDSNVILTKNVEARQRICEELSHQVERWMWTVVQEKAVFHTLNCLKADVTGMLRGQGWVVKEQKPIVEGVVTRSHEDMGLVGASMLDVLPERVWPTPPTSFPLNDFTYPFQEFVNTYGVPRYKEANPALFTAVTFPFLFGIMYGDIGHGTCLALAGAYLVATYKEDPKRGEMMGGIYSARYMIFMMGCFAVYAGFIYNDFFSLPLDLFKSSYKWSSDEPVSGAEANATCSYGDADCVYPFGVDPAWHVSDNELLFFNSMKMKMSVILGIIQMCLGITLKGMNAWYFNEMLDFYFEFLPMVAFGFGLFGYMIIAIFVKWSIDWDHRMYLGTCNEDNKHWPACASPDDDGYDLDKLCPLGYGGSSGGCQPPNLITTLINIMLSPGSVDEPMYPGQTGVQTFVLLLAFLAVPVLLVGKPLMIRYRNRAEGSTAEHQELMHGDEEGAVSGHGGGSGEHSDGDEHDEHNFSEIMIHQAIETIEFVLGMVSNTASYLRLWALSLAHTELAAVFWEKAMLATINMNNPVAILVGYSVFAAVTFAVLLAMDVLECFLHALRLHWVEFQNKFYKADGHNFQPFHLAPILKAC